jgi:formate transporter
MYLLPYALAIKTLAPQTFWTSIGQTSDAFPRLTLDNTLHNISVATMGNLLGGSFLVGVIYWFVYLRRRD